MTAEQHGTTNLLKIFDLVIEGTNVAPKVAAASGYIPKAMALLPLTDELIGLLSLEPGMVAKEWKDFSDEEQELFYMHAIEKLKIPDDEKLEAKIEAGLIIVKEIVNVVEKMVEYRKMLIGG